MSYGTRLPVAGVFAERSFGRRAVSAQSVVLIRSGVALGPRNGNPKAAVAGEMSCSFENEKLPSYAVHVAVRALNGGFVTVAKRSFWNFCFKSTASTGLCPEFPKRVSERVQRLWRKHLVTARVRRRIRFIPSDSRAKRKKKHVFPCARVEPD